MKCRVLECMITAGKAVEVLQRLIKPLAAHTNPTESEILIQNL